MPSNLRPGEKKTNPLRNFSQKKYLAEPDDGHISTEKLALNINCVKLLKISRYGHMFINMKGSIENQ